MKRGRTFLFYPGEAVREKVELGVGIVLISILLLGAGWLSVEAFRPLRADAAQPFSVYQHGSWCVFVAATAAGVDIEVVQRINPQRGCAP